MSKYLFNQEKNIDNNLRMFVYILHNHWADMLWLQVFSRKDIQSFLSEIAGNIKNIISDKIFTTNYDIYIDQFIDIEHLHGKFILPLNKFSEIITPMLDDKEGYEYSYLFGAGGIEKYNRINDITKMNIKEYDLSFFNDNNLELGTLLIYGLSFGKTEYITDEFLIRKSKYKEDYLFLSMDGHILKKLNEKKKDGKLKKIYVTYYKKDEKEYLEKLFTMAKLKDITIFIESKDVKLIKTI